MPYLPHLHKSPLFSTGLNSLGKAKHGSEEELWIEPNTDWLTIYQHKLRLYQEEPSRWTVASPGSEAVQAEFAQLLRDHLLVKHGDLF